MKLIDVMKKDEVKFADANTTKSANTDATGKRIGRITTG